MYVARHAIMFERSHLSQCAAMFSLLQRTVALPKVNRLVTRAFSTFWSCGLSRFAWSLVA